MKAAFLLNLKYIRRHLRQCVGVVLCISLLSGGILAALLYRDCADATSQQRYQARYGLYAAVIYGADPAKTNERQAELTAKGYGRAEVSASLEVPGWNEADFPFLGYMDEAARTLAGFPLKYGRFPESGNEVAMEESTLYKLKLDETFVGQEVSLSVHTVSGTETRAYRLVGIFGDYISRMALSDSQILGLSGIGDPIELPGVLTSAPSASPRTVNLFCPDGELLRELGGHPLENRYYRSTDFQREEEMKKVNFLTLTLIALFLAVIVIGVYNVAELSVRARERYIGLMRKIGFTPGQTFLLLFFQGAGLVLFSILLGSLFGVALLYAVLSLFHTIGQDYLTVITPLPFLIFIVFVTASILFAFLVQGIRLKKTAPLCYGTSQREKGKKPHEFSFRFESLWADATAWTYRHQNRLSLFLVAVCMTVTIFGSFLAVAIPRQMYASVLDYYQGTDYAMAVYGGTASPTTFYTSFPRHLGITQEEVDRLRSTGRLEVVACVGMTSRHHLMISGQTKNPFLQQLLEERVLENDLTPEVIRKAGGGEGDHLVEAPIQGIDDETLQDLLPAVTEGNIDPAAFAEGREIITANPEFSLGDELTIVAPILPEGSTQEKINGEIKISVYQARVSALLSEEKLSNTQRFMLNRSLLMSSRPMMQNDPLVKYDTVSANYIGEDKNSPEALAAEKAVKQVAAQSNGVILENLIQNQRDYESDILLYRDTCLAIVAVLVIIILLTFYLTVNIKVNTSLHSYLLLRSVGLDLPMLRRLLSWDILKNLIKGILTGGVIGFAGTALYASQRVFIPSFPIFVQVLLPVYLLLSLLLAGIGIGVAFHTAKRVLKKSVLENINDVGY